MATLKTRLTFTDLDIICNAVKDGDLAPVDERIPVVLRLREIRRWAEGPGFVTVVGKVPDAP